MLRETLGLSEIPNDFEDGLRMLKKKLKTNLTIVFVAWFCWGIWLNRNEWAFENKIAKSPWQQELYSFLLLYKLFSCVIKKIICKEEETVFL